MITGADGPTIQERGRKMVKLPNPVWMLLQESGEDTVQTNEGTLAIHEGDYLAYDPISGHVWPVAASYVAQHYKEADESGE